MVNNNNTKPTIQEVEALCEEKGYMLNAKRFFDEREKRGWISKKGKPIKDWKAALSNAAYRHKMAIGLSSNFKEVRLK